MSPNKKIAYSFPAAIKLTNIGYFSQIFNFYRYSPDVQEIKRSAAHDFKQKYFRTLTETENLTVKKMPQIKVLEIFAFSVYNKSLLCAT